LVAVLAKRVLKELDPALQKQSVAPEQVKQSSSEAEVIKSVLAEYGISAVV
jgi:hypothetical protein